MGMHADDALNDCLDHEEDRLKYLMGKMDILEAIERGVCDESTGEFYTPYDSRNPHRQRRVK